MWEELIEETDEPYMRELAQRYIDKLRAGQQQGEPLDVDI
jgi:hypothetical protein